MKALLQQLEENQIFIKVKGSDLQVDYYGQEIEESLLQQIRENKRALIAYLAELSQRNDGGKILKAEEQPDYPLSSSQYRLWLTSQFDGGAAAYGLSSSYEINGPLDIRIFREAFLSVIERHEVLRTIFRKSVNGEVRQQIKSADSFGDLINVEDTLKSDGLFSEPQLVEQFLKTSFDLESGPLVSSLLLQKQSNEFLFVCKMHHIAADGWSLTLFFNELISIYTCLVNSTTVHLPHLDIQYKDYAVWEGEQLSGLHLAAAKDYWKNQLSNEIPLLDFPADYTRPSIKSYNGNVVTLAIDKETVRRLKQIVYANEATLFMALTALVNALAYKYTNQKDIVLGCPVSGRNHADLEKLIGCFVNTIVLRTRFSADDTFSSLLLKTKKVCIDSFDFQYYPFDYLVKDVLDKRDISRSPLFDVMIILQNTATDRSAGSSSPGGLSIRECKKSEVSGRFDLTFEFRELNGELSVALEFNTDLFSVDTATRFIRHFEKLVTEVVGAPDTALSDLNILSKSEERQLLCNFNGSNKVYDEIKTITDLFEEQAAVAPDSLAVVFEEQQLSYKELNKKANNLAHYLQKKGVQQGDLVPICLHRSVEMIISILAIFKAGAAYVPIDPEYPADRIAFILHDTEASVVLGFEKDLCNFADSFNVLPLDKLWYLIAEEPTTNLSLRGSCDQLAYVIYTSGSTGKPKGVMVEHKGVLNRLNWGQELFPLTKNDKVLQKTTFCFDVSVWELLWPLINGATMIMAKPGEQGNHQYLKHLINEQQITVIHFIPSMLDAFLGDLKVDECLSVTKIFCSGDVLKKSTAQLAVKRFPEVDLYNLYGPTEASIEVTWWKLEKLDEYVSTPIGKPAPNVDIYILDEHRKICPIGCKGELYIGGKQVARGYLNNTSLTKEMFVHNPFRNDEHRLMFRTKDLARWLPDGNIEFFGRSDDQVKIRGYRIEPAEIEGSLIEYPGVLEAAVVAKELTDGDKQLMAYIVISGEFRPDTIRSYLKSKLPEYMVPYVLLQTASLPRLKNGKMNRKALVEKVVTDIRHDTSSIKAPRNSIDMSLFEIWSQILGINKLSIDGNFFENGGHSISAIRLASAVRDILGVEITISNIFLYPTIEALSDFIANSSVDVQFRRIERCVDFKEIPLSFNQERLWFIDQLEGSVEYHIPGVWNCTGNLNVEKLEWSFRKLVERHHVLRTAIRPVNGKPYQYVQSADQWSMQIVKKTDIFSVGQTLDGYVESIVSLPFDLSSDFMLRVTLVVMSENAYQLIVVFHHIAADAWSVEIMISELATLYNSTDFKNITALPELSIQYADFSVWQQNAMDNRLMERQMEYWRRQLSGFSLLDLPFKRKSNPDETMDGCSEIAYVDRNLVNEMEIVCKQEGITMAMLMLTFFNILLYRYSGQGDILVGGFVANRRRSEVQHLIGFFVNTVLFRTKILPDMTVNSLLREVKRTTLEAYDNQDMPFEKVLDTVLSASGKGDRKIFNVVFDYHEVDVDSNEKNVGFTEIKLSPYPLAHKTSKFDIGFMVVNSEKNLSVSIEYNVQFYEASVIRDFISHYQQLIKVALPDLNRKISDLNIHYGYSGVPAESKNHSEPLFDFLSAS